MIVNQGSWCQASVPSGAIGIRTAASILRREGYKVSVGSMGTQVTRLGILKMTMIDIRPGTNPDTFSASDILRCHVIELRENNLTGQTDIAPRGGQKPAPPGRW